jgi:hypothetical protein
LPAGSALAHDLGELPELGRRLGCFGLELWRGQAGFQRRALGQLRAHSVEIVGDPLQERCARRKRRVAVAVERFVGEAHGEVDFRSPAESEARFDFPVCGGIERVHRALGRRDVCRADEKFSCQCHSNSPFIIGAPANATRRTRYALGKAAISSAVVRIWWAKVGPFSSCAACIISCENAAVASRTRVT